MEEKEKNTIHPERTMTDQDFYDKAYSYFSYHAELRTNMINYFIGVFGAAVALYGALLQYPAACVCISGFMLAVSVLFLLIDIRTKFDIKHSEKVLCQFEKAMVLTGRGWIIPWALSATNRILSSILTTATGKSGARTGKT